MSKSPDASAALGRLLDVCDHLLGESGCPWDREQTLSSITPYLQEEIWEVLDAIARQDTDALREETGDMFYLLVFAAALAKKEGHRIGMADILNGVAEKLIRRHPHVFGDAGAHDAEGAIRQWEEIKKTESGSSTTLGKRPPGLPALTTAFRIQEKAAAVRFEWTDVRGALAKLREEIDELEASLEQGDVAGQRDEVGDILYSTVNVARYLGVDPEVALRQTIQKFMARFRFIEEELERRGRRPSQSDLAEMDDLWNEAKRRGIR